MGRVYTIHKVFICLLTRQACEEMTKPDCKNCGIYIQYKRSGQTIKQFGDEDSLFRL